MRKTISKTQYDGGNNANVNTTGNQPNVILIDDFLKLPASCVTTYVKGDTSGGISATLNGALYLIPFVKVLSTAGANGTDVQFSFTQESYFAEA